jgi:hypothetical protein
LAGGAASGLFGAVARGASCGLSAGFAAGAGFGAGATGAGCALAREVAITAQLETTPITHACLENKNLI